MNAQSKKETQFMRILVADDDDVAAFLLQCELNKLDEPFSFQRAETVNGYQRMLADFSPTLIIASSKLITPGLITQTRQAVPGARLIIIGAGNDAALTAQSLEYGATDCLFTSQLSELRLCLKQPTMAMSRRTPSPARVSRVQRGLVFGKTWLKAAWNDTLTIVEKAKNSAPARKITPKFLRLQQATRLQRARWGAMWKTYSDVISIRAHHFLQLAPGYSAFSVLPLASNPASIGSGGVFVPRPNQTTSRDSVRTARTSIPARKESEDVGNIGIEDNLARFEVQSLARELNSQIASREDAESALQSIDGSFRTLFESSLDAIFLLDSEGAVLQANSAACVLLACPITSLTQKRIFDFVDIPRQTLFASEWKGMLEKGFIRSDKTFVLGDGRRREVQCSAKSSVWEGVHLFIARDVTEPRKLSEEVEELRAALNKSIDAQAVQRRMLSDLEQRLTWFASSASKIARPKSKSQT